MTGFDPAELARLAEAPINEWDTKSDWDAYAWIHRAAIVAALTRAQEAEKAIERVWGYIGRNKGDGFHGTYWGTEMCRTEPIRDILRDAALGGATTTTGDEA